MRIWVFRVCAGLLVLACGIALGTGPLQHSGRQRDRELAAQKAKLADARKQNAALTAAGAFADAYGTATATALVAGKLAGRSVALIQLPGADKTTVDGLRTLLSTAGAQVSVGVTLDEKLASASSRQLVEALTSQMITQTPGLGIPADAAGYERFGLLLARSLGADPGAKPGGSPYDETAIGVVSGMQTAGLITVARAGPRASATIFVAGPPAGSANEAAANAVPVTIVKSYATKQPTLLAASTAAAGDRGVLGTLRADAAAAKAVTGVDSVQTPMGRVAVVLALVARLAGTVGQYGGVGAANGPVPSR
jgi:hypothetical protein